MNELQRVVDDGETELQRYDYEDGTVYVADLGAGADAAVDVVDGTVIVVRGDRQAEFDVTNVTTDADRTIDRAVIRNGVLTVEVSA